MDIDLEQSEADRLFELPKRKVNDDMQVFPSLGGRLEVQLTSEDKKEDFLLDIYKGRIDLQKVTYQNRGRKVIILVRLDIAGSPHQNPDGDIIPCPHLHRYREGYGDKWAFPPPAVFTDINNLPQLLNEFMDYCSIVDKPNIPATIF